MRQVFIHILQVLNCENKIIAKMDTAVYVKKKGNATRFTSVRCNDT